MNESLEPIFLLIPFLVFPFFFMLISYVIATFGGWRKLAKKYPLFSDFPTSKTSFNSARIGAFGKYNNALTVGVNQFGLCMKPIFFFSFGHEPLCFPWERIVSLEHKKFLFTPYVEITLQDFSGKIQLTNSIFKKYPEYIPHKFQKELM